MKTRFKLSEKRTIKANLVDKNGKLLTSIYDSGFSRLKQVYDALLSKCCNPPKGTKFSIYDTENDTYYSNY